MKNLIFLCSSIFIIILSIICLCLGPAINFLHEYRPCNSLVDQYNYDKKKLEKDEPTLDEDTKEKYLSILKEPSTNCYRHKAMIGLEFSAFIINVVFALFCTLFFLLNKIKIVGFLGTFTGLVGFVLTFFYVIYSGIIFTQEIIGKTDDYTDPYYSARPRIKSNGAFLEWDSDKKTYTCIFYSKNHNDSLYMTYSDLGNNYLYYLKERDNPDIDERNNMFSQCVGRENYYYGYEYDFDPNIDPPTNLYDYCRMLDESIIKYTFDGNKKKYANKKNQTEECEEILMDEDRIDVDTSSNFEKIFYQYWVTTLVFSCFIFVLDLVLLIIGVLFIKNQDESGEPLL